MHSERPGSHHESYFIAVVIILAVAFIVIKGPELQFNGMRLYFPDKKGSLREERRPIPPLGPMEERVREVVSELLLGPVSRALEPLVYADVSLARAVVDNRHFFLDFSVRSLDEFGARYRIFKEALLKSLHATIPGSYAVSLFVNGIPAF